MDTNEKKELLLRCCKKQYRRGRRTAAHIIDNTAACILAAVLFWLAVRTRIANTSAALLLTAICVLLFAAVEKTVSELRFNRFVRKLREETRIKISEQKARLNYKKIYEELTHDDLYICRGIEALTADEVCAAYSAGYNRIASLAAPTEAAKKLLDLTGIEVKSPAELNANIDKSLTEANEDEIDRAIISSVKTKKARGLKAFLNNLKELSRERALRYLFTGAMLVLLSFAVKYRIYYRLMGSACLAAGSAILTLNSIKSRAEAARRDGA